MHFEVIFQLLLCGIDAATTPVVCTSGVSRMRDFFLFRLHVSDKIFKAPLNYLRHNFLKIIFQ